MLKKYFIVWICLLFCSCSSAPVKRQESRLELSYQQLKLYDLDDINDLIKKKLAAYKSSGDIEILHGLLLSVMARQDDDNILDGMLSHIRNRLESIEIWEDAVENTVNYAISGLKNETTSAVDQVTMAVALQNLVFQFADIVKRNRGASAFETEILRSISSAEIIISDEAQNEARLNSMVRVASPSNLAADFLKNKK